MVVFELRLSECTDIFELDLFVLHVVALAE